MPETDLDLLIQAAEEKRDCEEVETKRFLVRTPLYDGANTSVSFAGEAVSVTGTGESETTEITLGADQLLPLVVTRYLRPGEARLLLKIEDVFGGAGEAVAGAQHQDLRNTRQCTPAGPGKDGASP